MIATTRTASVDELEQQRARLLYSPGSVMTVVDAQCTRVAGSRATVLLLGETGTGKEVVARLIHERSPRASRPFVPVNCASIPEALLESELFGHVRGAFADASAERTGRIASAEGGTLFLDEVGELPLPMQAKLLRVLQERLYEPVGATRPLTADFRLVAATSRNLALEVAAGTFRRDLYYRLLVCPIELPPLRTRGVDALHLFDTFWSERGETRPVSVETRRLLSVYPWPGNVRELGNLVERLSVCASGTSIEVDDLPPFVRNPLQQRDLHVVPRPEPVSPCEPSAIDAEPSVMEPPTASVPSGRSPGFAAIERLPIDLPGLLRRLEDQYIEVALEQSGGNKKLAADLLGLQRTTLVEKLRRRLAGPHS